MLRSLLFVGLLAWTGVASPAEGVGLAASAEVPGVDGRAARAVIAAQLKALGSARPAAAFSYASPAIRQQFGNAASFADMVRRSYPMLIRPASIGFVRPELTSGVIVQGVQIRDRQGNLWRAVYELQRQPDKRWRINGCAVAPDVSATTT